MVTRPGFQGEGLGHQATLGSGYFLTYMEACLPSRNATPLKTSPTCGVEEAVSKTKIQKAIDLRMFWATDQISHVFPPAGLAVQNLGHGPTMKLP